MKVETSNEDKVFFPDPEITKGDLLEYYESVSDFIIPHLEGRPLMMQRFPNGINEDGFYQKEAGDYFPDWMETVELEKEGGTVNHAICNNASSLKYLVNQGTVAFHTWLSKMPKIDNPDKLIIDLDPPKEDTFEIVRDAALALRDFFNAEGITAFPMTTGSSGVHVMVPLDGKSDFDNVRDVGKKLGERMTEKHPDLFTRELRKDKRDGKLFFDIQRNAYAQTAVSPFSVRAVKSAAVATPLSWEELEKKDTHSQTYTLKNIRQRLAQKKDPWNGYGRHQIGLDKLNKALENSI
ncbi:MAG TPA: non-homologous end-joining DNA ligase [Cryomorphaceae bacterium]|nr:non-homologous end-joining DNA ligase [Cryomorphaceae bacterium]